MTDAIDAFWRFWGESEGAILRAIDEGRLMEWVEPIGEHVRAIDEGLDWEFGRGRTARHYFCVSAKGDPLLRVTAERWLAAAPPPSESFEFHAARPGSGYAPRSPSPSASTRSRGATLRS